MFLSRSCPYHIHLFTSLDSSGWTKYTLLHFYTTSLHRSFILIDPFVLICIIQQKVFDYCYRWYDAVRKIIIMSAIVCSLLCDSHFLKHLPLLCSRLFLFPVLQVDSFALFSIYTTLFTSILDLSIYIIVSSMHYVWLIYLYCNKLVIFYV